MIAFENRFRYEARMFRLMVRMRKICADLGAREALG